MRRGDLVKLVRVLGMLGSDHAGERDSAARAAHRLQQASGESWGQILQPAAAAGREPRVVTIRRVDPFHDPLQAAASRIRQLQAENARLEREVRRLKRLLDARRAPPRPGRAARTGRMDGGAGARYGSAEQPESAP
ncbi:MAG TPA: hypothetical protein VEH84_05735 [Alphaproteobacteria bacterium]|nr:hypothetical protein [Alphaproteobacteria bacterium]